LAETLVSAEIVVVTQRRPEFSEAVQQLDGARVIDLVSIDSAAAGSSPDSYSGISW
jgi:hypothetical protein